MKLLFILIGVMLAGGAIAAGDDDHSHGEKIGSPAAAEDAGRTVEIVLYDNYYEPENVTAKVGEVIRFAIKNEGQLVHEFNIGTAAMHAAHKGEMLMMLQHGVLFPDRIDREKMAAGGEDGHSMKHDEPNSVLLEPGETAEVVWKFSEAAKLEFACNIPGHYEAGMVGEIKWQ